MKKYINKNRSLIMITLFLCIICAIASSFISIFLQRILDAALTLNSDYFVNEIIKTIIFFIVILVFSFIYNLMTKKSICKILQTLRETLYTGMISMPIDQFQKKDTAEYLSNFSNDIKIIEENYLNPIFTVIENIVLFISSLIIMIKYDYIIAGFTLLSILLMIVLPSLAGISLQKKQDNYSSNFSIFTNKLKDILMGFEVIKYYNIAKFKSEKFKKINYNLFESKYAVDKVLALSEMLSMLLALIMQLGVIILASYFVMEGRITVGTLLALTQLATSLSQPLIQIFDNIPKLQSTKEVIEKINKIADSGYVELFSNKVKFNNKIVLSNINFQYEDERPILKNINLEIKKGKKYAIIGNNGCGKSTLVKLLSGYFSNYSGTIYYDDIPISNKNREGLYNIISMVQQNIFLFNESIKDNICLYTNYPNEKINEVIKVSGLLESLNYKDISLDYLVKENGHNLSGGQKQRIAFARALIQNKPIIIMDEGTSAMEQKTSYELEKFLLNNELLTVMIITHKIDEKNLKNYDYIIVMDNGEVKEIDNYYNLIEKQGELYKLLHNNE